MEAVELGPSYEPPELWSPMERAELGSSERARFSVKMNSRDSNPRRHIGFQARN